MYIKFILKKRVMLFIIFFCSFFRTDGFMLSDQQVALGLRCTFLAYKDINENQQWKSMHQNLKDEWHLSTHIQDNSTKPSIQAITKTLEIAAPLFFNNRFLALKTIQFLKDHNILQNIPYITLAKTKLLQPLTKDDIKKNIPTLF